MAGEPPGNETAPARSTPLQELPDELRSYSTQELNDVLRALTTLQEAGFGDVASVAELDKKVKDVTSVPAEGFVTQYMAMCEWASTRSKWRASKEEGLPEDPASVGCSLFRQANDVAIAARAEATEALARACEAAASEDVSKKVADLRVKLQAGQLPNRKLRNAWNLKRRRGSDEEINAHFERWLDSQVSADREIQAMSDPGFEPKSFGNGAGVFFEEMKTPIDWVPSQSNGACSRGIRLNNFCGGQDGPWWSFRSLGKRETSAPTNVSTSRVGSFGCPSFFSLHVGGAGCNIGESFWNRLISEHGIDSQSMTCSKDLLGDPLVHFDENAKGRFVPRAIFFDAGLETLNHIQESKHFAPIDFISLGADVSFVPSDSTMDLIRQRIEKLDAFQGFTVTNAMTGRTGSKLSSELLKQLTNEYGKKMKWMFSLMPEVDEATDTDILNTVLGTNALIEHCDIATLLDNSALKKLAVAPTGLGLDSPGHSDFNGMIARTIAAVTSPLRMGVTASNGQRRLSTQDVITNLVPYPRVHFTVPTLAPLLPLVDNSAANVDPSEAAWQSLTHAPMASVDMSKGKHVALGLFCRGMEHFMPVDRVMEWKLRCSVKFVDWAPTGVSVSCHRDPAISGVGEAVALHNHGAISDIFLRCFERSGALEKPNGVESGYFAEQCEDLAALIKDFEEIMIDTQDNFGEDEEEE